MNSRLLRSKLHASGIHLGLSLVIFFVLLYLIVFHWFPPPYFSIDGGWQGVRIVAAVDLVLGPALTFIIFNPNKRLRLIVFDLGVIFIFQVLALIYGVQTTYSLHLACLQ